MGNKKKNNKAKGNDKHFLEKLPSNLPFPPFIRRPNYQLRNTKLRFNKRKYVALFLVIIFLGTFFIYIGGFYYTNNDRNAAFVPDPDKNGQPGPIWKYTLSEQTILEGITFGTLCCVGSSGMYLMHQSTHYAYSPSIAAKYLLIGVALTLFAMTGIVVMWALKKPFDTPTDTSVLQEVIMSVVS
jgi:magnesium-transporting ATPase (P-type)